MVDEGLERMNELNMFFNRFNQSVLASSLIQTLGTTVVAPLDNPPSVAPINKTGLNVMGLKLILVTPPLSTPMFAPKPLFLRNFPWDQ